LLPGSVKLGEELSAEEPTEETNREKEAVSTAEPALFVRTQASTGNDTMDMGMVVEVLAPGVQDRKTGDLCAEKFGVSAEGEQGLGNGAKENPVHGAAVAEREGRELLREGEHHVEVLDREEFLLALLEPEGSSRGLTLGAMPIAARVIDWLLVTADVTFLEVASESRGPALRQVVQDPALLSGRSVSLDVRRTVFADDIGHFWPMVRHFFFGAFWLSFSRSAISRRDCEAPTAM
jgi:hypothetical protein